MEKSVLSAAAVVERAALRVLAGQNPLDLEELAEALEAEGLELGDDPEERLFDVLDPERVVELEDGRFVDIVTLAEGLVLSHRLTGAEVANGRVALHPDLSLLDNLAAAGVELCTVTGPLEHDHDGDEGDCVLAGPEGWLGSSASEGDLLTVTVADKQTTVLVTNRTSTGTSTGTPTTTGAALAHAYAQMTADDDDEPEPVELFGVWLEAMVAEPEAFRCSQAPMSRLLLDAGLEARGEMVAPAGFDWDEWKSILRVSEVSLRWGLDEPGGLAWMIVSTAYERFESGDVPDDEDLLAGIAAVSSYRRVAQAFLSEELAGGPDLDGSVAAFARRLVEAADGAAKAGPLWLSAVCAERDGRTLEAETMVAEALVADDRYELALEDAAWYAADRGDARRAASLLRRAGVEADDVTLALYDRYARNPPALVGRNERCPCGSGRKYKHCHLGRASLPLSERCAFLYDKAAAYLMRGRHFRPLMEIAAAFGGEDDGSIADDVLADPIVGDLALFEGGVWNDFLRDRGILLPPDELLLAQQWQLIERSIHEIQAVKPGHGLTARDIRTGDVVEVTEHTGSQQLKEGDLVCARIVPDSQGYRIFGGVKRISLQQRDPLMGLLDERPGGLEVAAWFAAVAAPPRMVNYEHEPLVLCTLTYATDDPHAAAPILDQILEPSNPGEWVEIVGTEQMERTIRGFVRLEGDTITVDTNSEVRADRLQRLLGKELPGLQMLDDVRIPAADAMADRVAREPSTDRPALPEGAEAFMEQFAIDFERRWLDMSLPALAGLTPLQAADDPTRREDLCALLGEFDRTDTGGPGMNADRLRAALGITT